MSERPDATELKQRIEQQLSWSRNRAAASLLWKGYLTGLYEWGQIELEDYTKLCAGLPIGGEVELSELFGGEAVDEETRG